MTLIGAFEVLSTPVAPGIPDVPYVQQGSFFQISNVGGASSQVTLSFTATPAFVATSGAVSLFANYIDATGAINQVTAGTFLAGTVGFPTITIGAGDTYLFGVQYILAPTQSTDLVGGTPQDSFDTRGVVELTSNTGSLLVVTETVRQVFNNYDTSGNLLDVAESAYSVPIIGGPLLQF